MKNLEGKAIETFISWSNAFNSRDLEKQIGHMHFSHLRLANNKFELRETSNDFREAH